MLIHLMDLKKFPVSGNLNLKDLWLDPKLTALKYFLVEDKTKTCRPLPSSLARARGDGAQIEISCTDHQLSRIDPMNHPEALTREAELRVLSTLSIRATSFDDEDTGMVNYTSMIQSTEGYALDQFRVVSATSLCEFLVETSTGSLGKICDLIFDTQEWTLRFLLANDERQKGRQVLVDPEWIESIDPKARSVSVSLSREILVLEAVYDPRRAGEKRYEIDV